MFLLDTNIASYWMRGDQKIINQIKNYRPCDLSISIITLAEILYGIGKSDIKKTERSKKLFSIRSQLELYSFDESAAAKYGVVRTCLEKRGIPISEGDLQIAAVAVANDLVLVTHNTKEFPGSGI